MISIAIETETSMRPVEGAHIVTVIQILLLFVVFRLLNEQWAD